MDGLIEEKKSNLTYLSIISGRFALRVDEHQFDDSGNQITEERTYEDQQGNKKTIIERYFKGVRGEIQEAKIENGDYGAKIVLIITKGENSMHVSFKAESSYGRSFLFRAPNINPDIEVTLKPYNFDQTDDNGNIIINKGGNPKKVIGISVWQEDCGWEKDKVPACWDNKSEELPSWEKTVVMGKEKWNSDKQMDFLANKFVEWANSISKSIGEPSFNPSVEDAAEKVDAVMNVATEHAERKLEPKQTEVFDKTPEEDDDLPF